MFVVADGHKELARFLVRVTVIQAKLHNAHKCFVWVRVCVENGALFTTKLALLPSLGIQGKLTVRVM